MSWNYTPHATDATTVDRDKVRFQIGDTDPDEPLLSDEEILLTLDTVTSGLTVDASIMCLKSLAARFSRLGSYKVGKISVDGKAIAQAYSDRAEELSSSDEVVAASEEFAAPSFGGFKSGEDIDGTTAWDDWSG